jgi:DNA-binding transcriptional LysR family regulator
MIAVRVTGPMKMAVVGAPAYFAQWRAPRDPDELVHHSCVQLRLSPRSAAFAWPFVRDGKTLRISVDGRVAVSDADLACRAALDGLGIALTFETLAEPFIHSGQLVRVLEEWSPAFDGYFVYFSGRRQVPAALRALIDMIRASRSSAPAKPSLKNPFAKG